MSDLILYRIVTERTEDASRLMTDEYVVPVVPDYEAAWKMMQSIDDSMGLMKPTRPEALKMVVDAALGGTDDE